MPDKFRITAPVITYRTFTVTAPSAAAAVEKAENRLKRAGHEVAGGVACEPIETE